MLLTVDPQNEGELQKFELTEVYPAIKEFYDRIKNRDDNNSENIKLQMHEKRILRLSNTINLKKIKLNKVS